MEQCLFGLFFAGSIVWAAIMLTGWAFANLDEDEDRKRGKMSLWRHVVEAHRYGWRVVKILAGCVTVKEQHEKTSNKNAYKPKDLFWEINEDPENQKKVAKFEEKLDQMLKE